MRNSCTYVCITNQPACQRGLSSWFFLNKLHGKWECVLAPNNCRFSLCSDCCKSTSAGQFVRKKGRGGEGGLSNLFSIPPLFFFLLCEAFLLLSALHTELLRVVATLLLSKFVNLVCASFPLPFPPLFCLAFLQTLQCCSRLLPTEFPPVNIPRKNQYYSETSTFFFIFVQNLCQIENFLTLFNSLETMAGSNPTPFR